MRTRDLALALPPLLLAVAGLLHPMDLTSATSGRWLALHLVLIPVFPLLRFGNTLGVGFVLLSWSDVPAQR